MKKQYICIFKDSDEKDSDEFYEAKMLKSYKQVIDYIEDQFRHIRNYCELEESKQDFEENFKIYEIGEAVPTSYFVDLDALDQKWISLREKWDAENREIRIRRLQNEAKDLGFTLTKE